MLQNFDCGDEGWNRDEGWDLDAKNEHRGRIHHHGREGERNNEEDDGDRHCRRRNRNGRCVS